MTEFLPRDEAESLEAIRKFKETKKMEGEIVKSASGAQQTQLDNRFDLIPFAAVESIARRFAIGAKKYAARNWELAISNEDEPFAEARINHMMRHAALFAEFHRQEDLDAVGCNFAMLAHFKSHGMLKERP